MREDGALVDNISDADLVDVIRSAVANDNIGGIGTVRQVLDGFVTPWPPEEEAALFRRALGSGLDAGLDQFGSTSSRAWNGGRRKARRHRLAARRWAQNIRGAGWQGSIRQRVRRGVAGAALMLADDQQPSSSQQMRARSPTSLQKKTV